MCGWLEFEFSSWEEADECQELLSKMIVEYKSYEEDENNKEELFTAAVNFCSAWCAD